MKIVHICLCGPYTDGFNYQENVITRYHRKMGHDVTIIASRYMWSNDGTLCKDARLKYYNSDDVCVVRLPIVFGMSTNARFKVYKGLYSTIENEKPDILFVHDCQFLDVLTIADYAKKHLETSVFVDNHVDYINGAHGWFSRYLLHQGLWRWCAKKIEPYVKKFYGVLPARVDFLTSMYNIPKEKCKLLVMGGDDELIRFATSENVVNTTRRLFDIKPGDFLISTGGKFNRNRPEVINLMEAVGNLDCENIKLIVFGSVDDELKPKFDCMCRSPNVTFVGWQNTRDYYSIFAASNLVVFPGAHSVLWEETVAIGVPAVFRDFSGFHHVDIGGNAVFVNDISSLSIASIIKKVTSDRCVYEHMKQAAKGVKHLDFSYERIAKLSISD